MLGDLNSLVLANVIDFRTECRRNGPRSAHFSVQPDASRHGKGAKPPAVGKDQLSPRGASHGRVFQLLGWQYGG